MTGDQGYKPLWLQAKTLPSDCPLPPGVPPFYTQPQTTVCLGHLMAMLPHYPCGPGAYPRALASPPLEQ